MSKADEVKGRAKQAAGDLTNNDKLKREGMADRVSATAKEKVDEVKEKATDLMDRAKERLHDR